MIIKKIEERITHQTINKTTELEINGKRVFVYDYFSDNEVDCPDSDTQIDPEGVLDEEEAEELTDYLVDALDLDEGKELETSADTKKAVPKITQAT